MTDAVPRGEEARRGRRVAAAAGGLVVTLLAAGGIALIAVGGGSDDATAGTASQARATAVIESQDLVETEEVDGTLGYSDARKVINRLSGTVTWTPRVGAVVKTNEALYEIDGRHAYLLDGAFPAYRTLTAGLTGDDVRQLERNLRELDLDQDGLMEVDGTWDAGTTAAVQRWQRNKGIDDDGSIELGRIVFQPGERRIGTIDLVTGSSAGGMGGGERAADESASASAWTGGDRRAVLVSSTTSDDRAGGLSDVPSAVAAQGTSAGPAGGSGAPAGAGAAEAASPLMTTTSTKRIVTVDLETTRFDLAEKGASVDVEMPGGEDVKGRIVRVGRIARQEITQQDDDPPATIKLIIRLRRSAGVDLDQAPVDVRLEKERVADVLTIPVTALLAREGGTFAVEVRDRDRRRIVAVKTGLYTDGDVEISGKGLRAGMRVTNAEI